MFPIPKIPNTIVLANGEIPKSPLTLTLLQNSQKIICCDGAIEKLLQLGLSPTFIVGDFDSISKKNLIKYKNIITQDKSEEYNDLQKAIHLAIKQNEKDITILGGFGLRNDHALANLGIAISYSTQIFSVMISDYGVFIPIHSTCSFSTFKGQQISIFSFNKETEFTFYGLKYPVKNRCFKNLWEGSLNESLGEIITIECQNAEAAVFFAF